MGFFGLYCFGGIGWLACVDVGYFGECIDACYVGGMRRLVICFLGLLCGEIAVGGVKNLVLKLMVVVLLVFGYYELMNVFDIIDVLVMVNLLDVMGVCSVWLEFGFVELDVFVELWLEVFYELVE